MVSVIAAWHCLVLIKLFSAHQFQVKFNPMTFWLFFIQNVKSSVMRAHSCHWSISCYAQGCAACAYSFCVVFISCFGAIGIDWATGRKLQQVESHSQHASRCRKRETRSLGFKCAHCQNEYEMRGAMDQHRRHRSSVGTPCADPANSKSISFTARGDHSAGILRQHDILGVWPIPALFLLIKSSLHLVRNVIIEK
jgi:hypothetical protein